jgi:hypothetical protein
LQDFGFSVDFFNPHRLQDFDHTSLVVYYVTALIYLRVLPSTKLLLDLIRRGVTPFDIILVVE